MLPTLLFTFYAPSTFALAFAEESEIASDFSDLGTLLLGGFAAAVVVAVAFSFVKLRLSEKKAPVAEVLSINSAERK